MGLVACYDARSGVGLSYVGFLSLLSA